MFYHHRNFLKHDCVDGLRAVPSPSGITVLAGHPIPAMADFPLVNDEDHSNVYPSCFYQLFHIGHSNHMGGYTFQLIVRQGSPSERNRPPRLSRASTTRLPDSLSRDYQHTCVQIVWASCLSNDSKRVGYYQTSQCVRQI